MTARRSADRALSDGAARRRAHLGDGGSSVRRRGARVDPRGAGAGSRAARRSRARARGLRGRDLGRGLCDRGAGAVPRPSGAPLSPPADPTARGVRQSGLLHHSRSRPAQRRCARGGQSRRSRRARRDDGRAAGPDRRRRRVPCHVRVRCGAFRALLLAGGDPGRGDDREDRSSSGVPRARPRRRSRADLDRRVRWQVEPAALRRDLQASPCPLRRGARQRPAPRPRAAGGRAEAERAHPPAGRGATHFVLEPDFEGVLGFRSRAHKPERAWRRLARARPDELPRALVRAVRLALESAQPHQPSYS